MSLFQPIVSREENSATPVNNFDALLARELEHSLDIKSAIKGQYVVKPQVIIIIIIKMFIIFNFLFLLLFSKLEL